MKHGSILFLKTTKHLKHHLKIGAYVKHALLIKNLNLASCNVINNTLYTVCDSSAWDNTDNNNNKNDRTKHFL